MFTKSAKPSKGSKHASFAAKAANADASIVDTTQPRPNAQKKINTKGMKGGGAIGAMQSGSPLIIR